MTNESYQTVFEIGFRPLPWARVAHPLIFVVIGLLLIRYLKKKTPYLVMGVVLACFGSLFVLLSLIIFIPNFVELCSAIVRQ